MDHPSSRGCKCLSVWRGAEWAGAGVGCGEPAQGDDEGDDMGGGSVLAGRVQIGELHMGIREVLGDGVVWCDVWWRGRRTGCVSLCAVEWVRDRDPRRQQQFDMLPNHDCCQNIPASPVIHISALASSPSPAKVMLTDVDGVYKLHYQTS